MVASPRFEPSAITLMQVWLPEPDQAYGVPIPYGATPHTMPDLVDATDIDQWAPRRSAQGQLPQLVRRLIAESASTILRLDFPSGEGVQP